MPKHLVDLYQASIKEIEMNFTKRNGLDLTYYDTDFYRGPSKNTNYVMNHENISIE